MAGRLDRVAVASAEDLKPGEMRRVMVGRTSVLLVKAASGEYRALGARCSHQGAYLDEGRLGHPCIGNRFGVYELDQDREVIRCPWHGYEFDIQTGMALVDPSRAAIPVYGVAVEDGTVYISRKRADDTATREAVVKGVGDTP